jgi:hypothetical protein
MSKLRIKTVEELKGLTYSAPVDAEDEKSIVCSSLQLDYQYKDKVPVVSWQPSEPQEAVLEFLGKNGTFSASNIRQKLLSKDSKKWAQESKLVTDKFVLAVVKKIALFGISGFTCRISSKGNLTFRFDNTVPTTLPFRVTFRSPEEKREAALEALGKRVTKALDDKEERSIVEQVITTKTVTMPVTAEKIA